MNFCVGETGLPIDPPGSPPCLADFPSELVDAVLGFIDGYIRQASLALSACSRVRRKWLPLAQSRLFRAVSPTRLVES